MALMSDAEYAKFQAKRESEIRAEQAERDRAREADRIRTIVAREKAELRRIFGDKPYLQ